MFLSCKKFLTAEKARNEKLLLALDKEITQILYILSAKLQADTDK